MHAEIEFYPPAGASLDDILVTWTLVPGAGGETWVERESDAVAEQDAIKAVTELPVDGLPSGLYTLRARISRSGTDLGTISAALTRHAR